MATNVQEIFGIQENILINIIQENLRNCAFSWSKISPTMFQTNSLLINSVPWDVRIGKIPLYPEPRYYLEIIKCGKIIVAVNSGDNFLAKSLFDTAEEMFSPIKNIEDEAISVLSGCRCVREYNITGMGGVVVGGGFIGDVIGFNPPSGNCKVQFSGIFIGDILSCSDCVHVFNTTHGCCGSSSAMVSEIVGTGQTTNAELLLPNSHATTFDS